MSSYKIPDEEDILEPITINNVPTEIYLNLGNDLYVGDIDLDFSELGDVTWSEDKATNVNIKYIREDKDPLHRLNSLVHDYCLKLGFDKTYAEVESWFDVHYRATGKSFRALIIIPKVNNDFFITQCFEATTTKQMFDEAMEYYNKQLTAKAPR